MHLLVDDHHGVYVWVDDADESLHVSPHFDYIEDAERWYAMNVEKKNDQHQIDAN